MRRAVIAIGVCVATVCPLPAVAGPVLQMELPQWITMPGVPLDIPIRLTNVGDETFDFDALFSLSLHGLQGDGLGMNSTHHADRAEAVRRLTLAPGASIELLHWASITDIIFDVPTGVVLRTGIAYAFTPEDATWLWVATALIVGSEADRGRWMVQTPEEAAALRDGSAPVPEPTSLVLIGSGLLALARRKVRGHRVAPTR